ncbi:MAG: sigma-70 family RNA polymerase sigma factor [Planctomycetota bacterium]
MTLIGTEESGSISSTLLECVRSGQPDAWRRLVALYGPVVYRWCRQFGVAAEDSADVVQEVFAAVAAHIQRFERRKPEGGFSAWLHVITHNKARDHFRAIQGHPQAQGGTDAQMRFLTVCEPLELTSQSRSAPRQNEFLQRAVELTRAEFEPKTWEAFWRTIVEQQSPQEVAEELKTRVTAVYQAKYRVLQRLRQLFDELTD